MTLAALLATVLVCLGAGLVATLVVVVSRRLLRRHPPGQDVVRRIGRPGVALVTTTAAAISFEQVGADLAHHAAVLLAIVCTAWLVIAASGSLGGAVAGRYDVDVTDNRRARSIRTRLAVIRRVIAVVAVVVAAAGALMTFPAGRAAGTSLLASAGVAGLVAGIAGRSTLGNLVAGIQIAFASPIRLDDVVVVEDEWGYIEEITLTNVVVRIWDQRRLVLPASYFVEQPFENWTRKRADIIGEVLLHVDHRAPLGRMRDVLRACCEHSPRWDGRVCELQVVDATEATMVVRALVSARNAPTAWDLRCEVRERLLTFLADEHPEGLPRVRTLGDDERGAIAAGQTAGSGV